MHLDSYLKEMKLLKFTLNLFIVIVILSLMYHYLVPSEEESNCMRYNEFMELTMDGVIVNKCYDHQEHSYPAIDIKSSHDHSVQRFYIFGEKSNLFNLLCLSDTILKEKHSDIVSIKRNGINVNLVKVDFGCNKH
jgi:hypothetical protein